MSSYVAGTTVKISCTFAVNGALTDPTAVTLRLKSPAGTTTSYTYAGGTVSKAATGSYYKTLVLPTAGAWIAQWEGTGAAAGIQESEAIIVTAPRVP